MDINLVKGSMKLYVMEYLEKDKRCETDFGWFLNREYCEGLEHRVDALVEGATKEIEGPVSKGELETIRKFIDENHWILDRKYQNEIKKWREPIASQKAVKDWYRLYVKHTLSFNGR